MEGQFRHALGAKVRDTITGFEGIVTQRAYYLGSPMPRYGVQPPLRGGALPAAEWFDEPRLEAASAKQKARKAPARKRAA